MGWCINELTGLQVDRFMHWNELTCWRVEEFTGQQVNELMAQGGTPINIWRGVQKLCSTLNLKKYSISAISVP